ncbi:hypothetical protein [Xenorhabdus bovienii]|uniref:hypothetical protein n=1 Tax=Xenorhabdus bovienii TaxID=40576 RepID=UPI0023B3173D|nr:hypothetical protein [Xenorhabdus bovienii]
MLTDYPANGVAARPECGSVALSGHQVSSPVFERVQSDVPYPKSVQTSALSC